MRLSGSTLCFCRGDASFIVSQYLNLPQIDRNWVSKDLFNCNCLWKGKRLCDGELPQCSVYP
jgi:hypothetical protein